MNFRNRKLVITIRTVLGLMFLFSGVTGFMAGASAMQGVPAEMVPSSQALWDFGIFQIIKTTEIIAGLMLITGTFPALAAVLLAPIPVGATIYTLRVSPMYVTSGLVVGILLLYLGYAYWDKYKVLFENT